MIPSKSCIYWYVQVAELAADCNEATKRYSQEVVAHGRDIQRLDVAEAQVAELLKQISAAEVLIRLIEQKEALLGCVVCCWAA
jgi:hypothetical protein